jgi:hypothetical protein
MLALRYTDSANVGSVGFTKSPSSSLHSSWIKKKEQLNVVESGVKH